MQNGQPELVSESRMVQRLGRCRGWLFWLGLSPLSKNTWSFSWAGKSILYKFKSRAAPVIWAPVHQLSSSRNLTSGTVPRPRRC